MIIALRTMSSLACVYTDKPSGMIQQIHDEQATSVLEWFKEEFLPLCLLRRNNKSCSPEDEADQADADTEVWFELD